MDPKMLEQMAQAAGMPGVNADQMKARPAPPPSPYFVPGLPHVVLIELRQAFILYQDDHMLLLTLAGRGG